MDKYWEKLADIAEIMLPVVLGFSASLILEGMSSDDTSTATLIGLFVLASVIVELLVIIIYRKVRRKHSSGVGKLEQWIEYDKKRKEIEEQMDRLHAELIDSNMSRYVDLNRLIISGQSSVVEKQMNCSDAFLQQYGLDKNSVTVKENSAVFLTPFNQEGHRLYRKCQQVLGDMGILLRRSDNYVEKDNILANIISLIVQSEFVVANIDGRNPNVYYEIGIAHAIGKPTILISKSKGALEDVGFDIRQKRIILYETDDDLDNKLMYQISMLKSPKSE